MVKAKNDVLSGIRTTAELLRQRRIVICEDCPDILREFGLYRWDQKTGADRVKKEFDHAMDDMRYFAADLAAETGSAAAVGFVERGRF